MPTILTFTFLVIFVFGVEYEWVYTKGDATVGPDGEITYDKELRIEGMGVFWALLGGTPCISVRYSDRSQPKRVSKKQIKDKSK